MKIIDVSVSVANSLPVWEGDPPVVLERVLSMDEGADYNLSRLSCGVHTGTHVDAPLHFVPGATSVDRLPLKMLIGPAYVLYLPRVKKVTREILATAGIPPRTRRLLLRTRNSTFWRQKTATFRRDYVGLDDDAAQWVVARRLQLIGVDYLSVAAPDALVPAHQT